MVSIYTYLSTYVKNILGRNDLGGNGIGAKRLGYVGRTTRVENRGETTRGETTRGETSWGRNVLLPSGYLIFTSCSYFMLSELSMIKDL